MTTPQLTPGSCAELRDLWSKVADVGGAVGVVPALRPVDVAPLAEPAFARAAAGADGIVVAFDEGHPVGFGILGSNDIQSGASRASVRWHGRRPTHTGRVARTQMVDCLGPWPLTGARSPTAWSRRS